MAPSETSKDAALARTLGKCYSPVIRGRTEVDSQTNTICLREVRSSQSAQFSYDREHYSQVGGIDFLLDKNLLNHSTFPTVCRAVYRECAVILAPPVGSQGCQAGDIVCFSPVHSSHHKVTKSDSLGRVAFGYSSSP